MVQKSTYLTYIFVTYFETLISRLDSLQIGLERYWYWVIGYWAVLLLGDIFCCSDTQYNTNQTAVSTVHMPVNNYLVPLVTCTLTDAIVCLDTMLICCCLLNTIIVIIIEFWDFLWSLLCYTLVSVLVLGIGIARGQYYWVLDIGCLSWYRSNPIYKE